jgi:hypothetical protein
MYCVVIVKICIKNILHSNANRGSDFHAFDIFDIYIYR